MFVQLEVWQYSTLILLAFINLYTFVLYFVDKRRAIARKRRISERKLIMSTLLFGGVGASLGMSVFHHKTKKIKFKMSASIAFILTLLAFWLVFQF